MLKLLSSVALGALALAGCYQCPQCPQIPLASGSFVTTTPGVTGAGTPASTFPWSSDSKQLDVDLAAHTVHLRYTRDGHQVVETYRIASLTECPQ